MLQLHGLLTDRAILQRGCPIPISGRSEPNRLITVKLGSVSSSTTADATGHWCVVLDPLEAGGPFDLAVTDSAGQSLVVHNILIGDVWVCSGQSNMEMPLRDAENGPAEAAIASEDTAAMRLFLTPRRVTDEPAADLGGTSWTTCNPEAAAGFSGVGYYFGRHLSAATDVPIGLIQAAVGATPGESWVRLEVLNSDPDFAPILERWREALAAYPDAQGTYAAAFARWDQEADRAEREGRRMPGAQPKLVGPGHTWTPSGLWNGMISPLTTMPIRGVIWAQGAAHPERACQYRKLFRALIRDWRKVWQQRSGMAADFPFLFVQEAAFGPRREQPGEHTWAELREAQAMALAEPNTAMAVALDTGEEKNIHPVRKKPVGDRLALAARALVHGHQITYSGPIYRSMRMEDGTIRLCFDHAAGLATSDQGEPLGLAISGGTPDCSATSGGSGGSGGGNRGFVWARGRIEGEELVVWSDQVPHPIAVRYAWTQNPQANLINGAGLPAGPFRTDDWPGITVGIY